MQMYPGAGYKEHQYKVETDDFMYKEDFHFNKNSGMNKFGHSNHGPKHNYVAADHHLQGRLGPNMHMMKNPNHCNPNSNNHGYGGGYYGPNKHGMNYSETIYEQEETQYHANKFDNHYPGHHGGVNNHNHNKHHGYMSGVPSYGGRKEHERYYPDGRMQGTAMWDSKGIDD